MSGLCTDATQCAALLITPPLLREKVDHFIQPEGTDTVDRASPIILWTGKTYLDGQFSIYAENILLAKCDCIVNAFMCLLATFYIFNIAFPKDMTSALTFLQKVIMNHTDGAKKDNKVIGLLTKLNRL